MIQVKYSLSMTVGKVKHFCEIFIECSLTFQLVSISEWFNLGHLQGKLKIHKNIPILYPKKYD
jgi:hypothetical protein